MMGIIGVSIGLVGFLLHQLIHLIAEIKWERAEHFIQVGGPSELLADLNCMGGVSGQLRKR